MLRDKIRNIIFVIIYFTGIHLIYRWFFQKNQVTILLFHEVAAPYSKKIFNYLNKKYNIISLRDYVESILNEKDNFYKIKNKLIITFDDGHKSNYDMFNKIKAMNIPITIFLTTGIIGTKNGFWWNNNFSNMKNEELKKISDDARINILKKYGFDQKNELSLREALSDEEIFEMKDTIDFQSHSVSHPILVECDENKARNEIEGSKLYLEKHFNIDVFAFAYPNGDWNKREQRLAIEADYKCILTTIHGYNNDKSDLFSLKRISAGTGRSYFETIIKSTGIRLKK